MVYGGIYPPDIFIYNALKKVNNYVVRVGADKPAIKTADEPRLRRASIQSPISGDRVFPFARFRNQTSLLPASPPPLKGLDCSSNIDIAF